MRSWFIPPRLVWPHDGIPVQRSQEADSFQGSKKGADFPAFHCQVKARGADNFKNRPLFFLFCQSQTLG